MSQLTYSMTHSAAYEGGRGDSRPATIMTGRNNSGSEMPYGRFVVFDSGAGTTELAVKPPSATGQKPLGVSLWDAAHEPQTTGIPDKGVLSVLKEGTVWMIAEGTVGPANDVFMRHTAQGSPGASDGIGRVRADSNGVAEVHTITPTAVNSTVYQLVIGIGLREFVFTVTSSGAATATNIGDLFRTAMAADTAFTALVVASGTTTLILTGQTAGQSMTVQNGGLGVMTDATTTPAAPKADKVLGARFLTTATIGLPVMVQLNLP